MEKDSACAVSRACQGPTWWLVSADLTCFPGPCRAEPKQDVFLTSQGDMCGQSEPFEHTNIPSTFPLPQTLLRSSDGRMTLVGPGQPEVERHWGWKASCCGLLQHHPGSPGLFSFRGLSLSPPPWSTASITHAGPSCKFQALETTWPRVCVPTWAVCATLSIAMYLSSR